jgi:uncharacterized protein with HEPN domain
MTDEGTGSQERKELDRLLDIKDAIENIQGHPRYLEGKQAWDDDKYYRGYCERQLGIVGEAASRLSADFDYEIKHPDVPWRQVKALRNISEKSQKKEGKLSRKLRGLSEKKPEEKHPPKKPEDVLKIKKDKPKERDRDDDLTR